MKAALVAQYGGEILGAPVKAAGYNLDIKNPHVVDPGHGDPDELLRALVLRVSRAFARQ